MKIFSGRRFSVETKKVKLPNGNRMNLEKVHSGEVALILPILDKDTVIMLKEFRPVIGKWQYELPAGLVDPGERPIDAAKRELREETGFTCKKIKKVISLFSSPGFSDEVVHVFLATQLEKGEQELEPAENIELHQMPLSKTLMMIKKGEIDDAHSIAALLFSLVQEENKNL